MKRSLFYLLRVGLLALAMGSLGRSMVLAQTPQVRYGVRYSEPANQYTVYMTMTGTSSLTGTNAIIASAQVTLRVPHGTGTNKFLIQNMIGAPGFNPDGDPSRMTWFYESARSNAPPICAGGSRWATGCTSGTVASTHDYISIDFGYSKSPVYINLPVGQEIELFRFNTTYPCRGPVSIIDNALDPFMTPNSRNTNTGNQMTLSAFGTNDVYAGNLTGSVGCQLVGGTPDIQLGISGPATLTAGAAGASTPGTYTINLNNVGTAATSGVLSVTTLLPAGLAYGGTLLANGWSCTPTSLTNGNTQVVCQSSAAISASAAASYSFQVTPAVNLASASFSAGVMGGGDINLINNTASQTITVVQPPRPDLLVNTIGPASIAAGATGSFSLIVANTGTPPMGGATTGATSITFTLPANLNYASFSGSGWGLSSAIVGGQTVYTAAYAAAIGSGAAASTLVLSLQAASGASSGMVSWGGAVSTSGETITGNNGFTRNVTLIGVTTAPGLTVALLGPGTLAANTVGAYTINITNNGNAATTGATSLTFSLPAGLTYNGYSGNGWTITPPSGGQTAYTATYANAIGVGASASSLIVNLLAGSTGGVVNFGGSATTPGQASPVWVLFGQQITITAGTPGLTGGFAAPGSFTLGTPGTLAFNLTNNGTGATTGPTTVTMNVPAGINYSNFTGNGWQVNSVANGSGGTLLTLIYGGVVGAGQLFPTLNLNVTPVNVSAPVSLSLVGNGSTPGWIGGTPPGTLPISQTVNVVPAVTAQPVLSVSVVGPTSPTANQSALYSVLINNSGAATTGPITVTFTLPNGLSYNGLAQLNGWSVITTAVNGQLVYTAANSAIVPGGSNAPALVLNLLPSGNVPGLLGPISGNASTPGDLTNPFNLAVTLVTTAPSLGITINGPALLTVGSGGSYTIAVTNAGSAATTGATSLTFSLPTGLTYNGYSGNGWTVQLNNGTYLATYSPTITAGTGQATPLIINLIATAVSNNVPLGGSGTTPGQPSPVWVLFNLNVSVVAQVVAPNLSATMTGPANLTVGQTAQFTVTVGNSGGATTGPITTTFTLPGTLSYNGLGLINGWGITSTILNGQTIYTATYNGTITSGGTTPPLVMNLLAASANAPGTTSQIGGAVSTPGELIISNNGFGAFLFVSPRNTGGGPTSQTANLSTSIIVLNTAPNPTELVPVRIIVTNTGPNAATGVVTALTLPMGNPIMTQLASVGTYNPLTGLWTIGTVSPGQSVTLNVTFSALTGGISTVSHQIITSPIFDPNSTPGNNQPGEDDQAQACFSVPVELCSGQTFQASLSGTYTSIQWRRNGIDIPGAMGTSLTINGAGVYTVVTNVGCGAGGCCPLIVRESANCCPANLCVPMAIRKTR